MMNFEIKKTKEKEETIYRTIYIKKRLTEKIEELAKKNNTSWNNIVISMIESCLKDE